MRNTTESQNFNHIPSFAQTTHNNGPLTYAQVAGANDGANNVLHKIESMLEKQIELTNTLMNMMSMLMAKLCN